MTSRSPLAGTNKFLDAASTIDYSDLMTNIESTPTPIGLPPFTAFAMEVRLTTGEILTSDPTTLADAGLTMEDLPATLEMFEELLSGSPDRGGHVTIIQGRTWHCVPLRTVSRLSFVTSDAESAA